MKYVLMLLLLYSTQLHAWSCKEPEWLNICEQVHENCVGDLDIVITVAKRKNGWVRFDAHCTNKELDPVYGYAKYIMGEWKLITFGTAIDEEYCNKVGIPEFIR